MFTATQLRNKVVSLNQFKYDINVLVNIDKQALQVSKNIIKSINNYIVYDAAFRKTSCVYVFDPQLGKIYTNMFLDCCINIIEEYYKQLGYTFSVIKVYTANEGYIQLTISW